MTFSGPQALGPILRIQSLVSGLQLMLIEISQSSVVYNVWILHVPQTDLFLAQGSAVGVALAACSGRAHNI